jgi:TonB family protein
VRKALIISLICHVALTAGICQWKAFQSANDDTRNVYEVELVDGVHSENSVASVKVQPAVLTPEGPQNATRLMPAPAPAVEQKNPERDLMAPIKIRGAEPAPPASTEPTQNGNARTASPPRGTRFAIDAPPGESELEPIGDLEARGAALQPLHVTHPGAYTENYILLHSAKPKYPDHERERSIEGSVTVELLVDEYGNVAHADVLELVGPESFSRAVLDAVRLFEFQPPIENGEPSTMWIKFKYTFHLNS